MQPLRPYEKLDTLQQFLEHDRQVLRFDCHWDDTGRLGRGGGEREREGGREGGIEGETEREREGERAREREGEREHHNNIIIIICNI